MTDMRETDAEQDASEQITAAPDEPPESPPVKSTWPKWTGLGAIVLALVLGGWFLVSSLTVMKGTHDDALAELESTAAALSVSESENEAVTEELGRLTAELEADSTRADHAEDQLAQSMAEQDRIEVELAESREELAGAIQDLAEVRVQLDEADETREGIVEFLAASFTVGTTMDEDSAACLTDALVEEMGIADLLAATVAISQEGTGTSDTEMMQLGLLMVGAAVDCGIPMDTFGAVGQPGIQYGDNTVLDALYDQCAAGSGVACDQLYWESAVGSDYERFGATCGDRIAVPTIPGSCVDRI